MHSSKFLKPLCAFISNSLIKFNRSGRAFNLAFEARLCPKTILGYIPRSEPVLSPSTALRTGSAERKGSAGALKCQITRIDFSAEPVLSEVERLEMTDVLGFEPTPHIQTDFGDVDPPLRCISEHVKGLNKAYASEMRLEAGQNQSKSIQFCGVERSLNRHMLIALGIASNRPASKSGRYCSI